MEAKYGNEIFEVGNAEPFLTESNSNLVSQGDPVPFGIGVGGPELDTYKGGKRNTKSIEGFGRAHKARA